LIDGDFYEVPMNPPSDKWEVWETTIHGVKIEGYFYPQSTISHILSNPFLPEDEVFPYAAYEYKHYNVHARGNNEEESRRKCEKLMRSKTGFDGDLNEAILKSQDENRIEYDSWRSETVITGSVSTFATN
jgi:hypothetical protein